MIAMIWFKPRRENTQIVGKDMRKIYVAVAGLVLSACAGTPSDEQTIDATGPTAEVQDEPLPVSSESIEPAEQFIPTYNEEIWYLSSGWPGEYPPGFSVLGENISLMGRAHMHKDAAQNIACPVAQNATFQQWNMARVDADKLEFMTVSQRVEISVTENAVLDAPTDDDWEKKLTLEPGDRLTYLRYLGEGWVIMEHAQTEYQIEEGALVGISDIETAFDDIEDDQLWINVACDDETKTRAWLELDEVLETEGIVMTPIIGFGDARDMTEQDRVDAIEQMKFYLEEKARGEEVPTANRLESDS